MMVGVHDPLLVVLSILIAVASSYTALDLGNRILVSGGRARNGWLLTAALTMGGGIWAMHFVAMLAFSMVGMQVEYGAVPTLLSLLLAVAVTGLGFFVITRVEEPRAAAFAGAGLLMGLGIAGMHYLGMAAMRTAVDIAYDPWWFAGSVVIAVAAATAALRLSLRTNRPSERMAGALVMGLAVAGMHYVAMAGTRFTMRDETASPPSGLDPDRLALAVAAATFLILSAALVAALIDRRHGETQKRLRDDLRAAYDRQSLMLRLVERMRVSNDPAAIMRDVAEGIARHLEIDRAGFFRVDDDETIDFDAGGSWGPGALPPLAGTMAAAAFGPDLNAHVRTNGTILIADARLDECHAAFLRIGTRACVCAPLSRDGRWKAGLYCNHSKPRDWDSQEVLLVEELAALTWDAVDRAEARVQLQRLNERLETRVEAQERERSMIADALPVLIAFMDRAFTYRYANRAAIDWFGLPPNDVIGRTMLEVLGETQFELRRPYLLRTLAGEAVQFELPWPRRDGTSRTAEIRFLPRSGPDGRTEGFYIFVIDVTDRAQAEELLRTMNARLEALVEARTVELGFAEEQLRQAQKMEAVGQLTGGLAHDFNNLLAGVLGALELMQRRIAQGRHAEIDRYVATAQGAATRAAALTHRLLAFSRRQTLDPKVTDVARLIDGMTELVRRTVGPAVRVEVAVGSASCFALVDPNQLENALLNLCINARDAMPDGGRIDIQTRDDRFDVSAARERELAPGDCVSLSVRDTGTGMTPEVVRRAFDPFFTTKPTGMGTGLGLSMIYGFARQSGGQVRIQSATDEGTTVHLHLPRHAGSADEAEAGLHSPAAPRGEPGQTVLVVDDEMTVRLMVVEVLEDLGYRTLEAEDAPSGLAVLESDVRIDLLVSDVGLPGGMNGRQMADRARVLRPDLNVLFITGYAEASVVGDGSLDPGMQVLVKPFTIDILAARMQGLIRAAETLGAA